MAMVGTLVLAQFLTILYGRSIIRLGAIFNFNFTILHTKVANNSLIICEHLGGYLKEFQTIRSIFEIFYNLRIC